MGFIFYKYAAYMEIQYYALRIMKAQIRTPQLFEVMKIHA